MQIEVAKVNTYVFYDAVIVTSAGIRNYARLAMVCSGPLEVKTTPFEDDPQSATTVTGRMIGAAGAKFWHKLEGSAFIALCHNDQEKGEATVELLQAPAAIASAHTDYHHEVDMVPREVVDNIFPEERFREGITFEEVDVADLLRSSLERAKLLRKLDSAHGFAGGGSAVQDIEKMAETLAPILGENPLSDEPVDDATKAIADRLRKGLRVENGTLMPEGLLKNTKLLSEAMKHCDKDYGIHSGESQLFVPVEATDFHDVAITSPDGIKPMRYIRVMHSDPPVWHEREANWPDDLLGYWKFKNAALGETVNIPGANRSMVGFMTVVNLSVVVKRADAISPAGKMTVPLFVWQHMNEGKEPVETMDEAQGLAYNEAHALPTEPNAKQAERPTLN